MDASQERRKIYDISINLYNNDKITELMEYLFSNLNNEGNMEQLYSKLDELFDNNDEQFGVVFYEIMKAFE